MILNPVPAKIPAKIQNDPELSGFFNELIKSVYQMNQALNGSKNIVLISTTEGINAKTVASTELFKVPAGKTFIPLFVVIRVTNFVVGFKSVQVIANFGGNSASYNDFLSAVTYTVSAIDTFQIDQPNDATQLVVQASDDSFRLNITTASDATTETWAVDVFGYIV